jgi:hypothetical protein
MSQAHQDYCNANYRPEDIPGADDTAPVAPRFQHSPQMYVGVSQSGRIIHIGIAKRDDFDRIDLPCEDCGENENGHVLIKTLGEIGVAGQPSIIFQYWIKSRTIEAFRADRIKEDGQKGMEWWNGLSDDDRKQWAAKAGNTGRAADAWEAYKRQKAGS